ncbi:hypothetical protein [Azoarcus sp. KH32C]|uniref:hypothetical protein n=1 Tax=Azoarcus sp. KH32C TaxID=748247 RepID=UPI0002386B5B|nr:hypothetical protein [Azoarcus sp. KH32C]BAL24341.1 hypothetical protein AZKH_2028 [Azoarcus sp. KH32C]
MQIHLVIPGLIWPGASAIGPASGLQLPALARLLGLGHRHVAPFEPLDRQLARLLGYPSPNEEDAPLPLAALRRLGEDAAPPPAASHWLCADPVNLSFAREHLLLNDFPEDELSPDEVAALIGALNETFSDIGQFEACTPARWYLRLAAPTRARLYPLHDVVGRPIQHFLPEGEDARLWQRTMNEIQVVLHNHRVNQARESAGRRPANSLWLWGAGELAASARRPATAVQTREPLTRGLARAAGVEPTAPDCTAALKDETVVIIDSLLKPALQLDIDRWRNTLVALEREWFAPLADAIRTRRVRSLRLTAPGDRGTLELAVQASDRWKFWRKPYAFDALLKTMAPPPAPTGDAPQAAESGRFEQ